MNEEMVKKQIGELLLAIGEGKFQEKAREVFKYQFNAGYRYKEEKIKQENNKEKASKLEQIKKLFDEKDNFYENETISELFRELYWKLENEIYKEEEKAQLAKQEDKPKSSLMQKTLNTIRSDKQK